MKQFTKRFMSVLLAIVMLSFLFTACGSEKPGTSPTTGKTDNPGNTSTPSTEKTVIRVLRPGTEEFVRKWAEPAAEEFNSKNPDIKVEFEYDSFGGWINRYTTVFAANDQPDIIFWWDNQLREKGVAEKLVAFDGIVDPEVLDKYPQNLKDIGTINGKLYYLPQAVDPVMVYYNKDIFKKAGLDPDPAKFPKTWDEFAAACKTIYEKTGIPALGFQGKTGINTLQEFVALFYHQATGKAWLDDNNQPIFNTPEAVVALDYLKKLKQYCQVGFENAGRGDLRVPFRDGQIAMTLDGSWINQLLIQKYGEDLDNSIIGMAPTPNGPVPNVTWLSTNGWIIARSDHAQAAGKVLSFLISEEQLYKHHKAYGANPILKYELDYPPFQYKYWSLAPDIIKNNTLFTMIGRNHPTPKAFYVQFEDIWQQFLLDELTSQKALDLAEKAANEINARAGIGNK